MPVVSLIIPAYNAGRFLDATLNSASHQTLRDIEIIMVDDFSDDDTLAISKRWRAKDRRIQILTQRANSGVSAARNAGLRIAQGQLVAFLDADDLLMLDSLALRLQAYQRAIRMAPEQSSRIAGSYCASQSIPEELGSPPPSKAAALSPLGFVNCGGTCPFNANQPLIRTDVLLQTGGFNETMSDAEDYDLWARILRSGYWFVPAPHVAVTYRNRQGSAVRKTPRHHLQNSLALHDSALQKLDATTLTRSPYRLTKPHADYSHQATKAGRVLQFSGMEIASTDNPELARVADDILHHIPDLQDVQMPGKPTQKMIREGMQRQLSGPLPDEQSQNLDKLMGIIEEKLTDQFSSTFSETNFGPYMQPDRDRLWHPDRQAAIDVMFLPHKDYHLWTIGLAASDLRSAGINFAVIDMSAQWRDGGVRTKAAELGLPLISCGEFILGDFAPRLIVTFNDWDYVTRPILVAAQEAGIPTAAIVEGIQDYLDVDTGRQRHAYQTVDTVLLPGDFDRRYFDGNNKQNLHVAGVPRIQYLRSQRPERSAHASKQVLINSNFSHNVLTEKRDEWLKQVVTAVQKAGMVPVISRHPEDRGTLFPEYVTTQDFYKTLNECALSVQRFASGILESLASNVPVIYYNPHGEKVDKFSADPMGAYPVVSSAEDLLDRLNNLALWQENAIAHASDFLDHHAGPVGMDSGMAIATILKNSMGEKPNESTLDRFRFNMRIIDQATLSLTRRVNIFENPTTAVSEMRQMVKVAKKTTILSNSVPLESSTFSQRKNFSLLWKTRVTLHGKLESLYHKSERWPWIQNRLRKFGEYYLRHFSPL